MEEFRVITDFPDYKINRTGDIYRINNNQLILHNIKKSGYHEVALRCNKTRYYKRVSRLVYLMFGNYPESMADYQIDHIDRNRDNNNISNLRLATKSENETNKVKRNGLSSEFLGVSLQKNNKWRSGIKINNKKFHLGEFIHKVNGAYVYDLVAKQFKNTDFYINLPAENLELPEEHENREERINKAIEKINYYLGL